MAQHTSGHAHGDHHDHSTHIDPTPDPTKASLTSYIPLGVIIVFIIICSFVYTALTGHTVAHWMSAVMGYFFIFFSLFKLIDLRGFAQGFSHYDVIARRFQPWAFAYPFIELALGVLYLLNVNTTALHAAALIIALLNVISVALKLVKKERFICACLGTILKVPLTTVTLIEYAVMAVMAAVMIVL